jgi:hypothetical protein
MRTIRASEIGTYLYCSRAWWYQKSGAISENQAELVHGNRLHKQHGWRLLTAGCLQYLAYLLLLGSLALAAAALARQVL